VYNLLVEDFRRNYAIIFVVIMRRTSQPWRR